MDPVKKVFTFNLHRALQGFRGKQKAARAIREIKKFAAREMKVNKVVILPSYVTTSIHVYADDDQG